MNNSKIFAASLLALLAPGLASAGGDVPAPAPAPVVIPEPAFNWSGAYVGGQFGVASGTYGNGVGFPADGEGDLNGHLFGLTAGYMMQSGSFVFGGEAAIAIADISGTEDCVNPAFQCAAEIDMVGSLRGVAGYLYGPDTLLYANAGITAANVLVSTDDGTGPFGSDETINGFTLGVGVEQALGSNMSARLGIQHYMFDAQDYLTDTLYQDVDIDFTTLEIGLNYRF